MSRPFAQPLDLTGASTAFRNRFWSKVDIRTDEECWEWTAYRNANGYGQFTVSKGNFHIASRVSMALTTPIELGLVVCHKCDNPPCVNPAHLFLGTQQVNGLDSAAKGRTNRTYGQSHRSSRLTPQDVAAIRVHDFSRRGELTRVARQYGVAPINVKLARSGVNWRSVETPPVAWAPPTKCRNGHEAALYYDAKNGCKECKRTYRTRKATQPTGGK